MTIVEINKKISIALSLLLYSQKFPDNEFDSDPVILISTIFPIKALAPEKKTGWRYGDLPIT